MTQNIKKKKQLYALALDCVLPLYSKIGVNTVEAIFDYIYEGVRDVSLLAQRSEGWIIAAYKELRAAEILADRWMDMDIAVLYNIRLDGLDDFSLATYASIVQERDAEEAFETEKCARGWDRAILAYSILTKNSEGSVLLDYGWLYRDLLGYQMVLDDDAYCQILERMVAFEYKWGTEDTVLNALGYLACDSIATGRISAGSEQLVRILESRFCSFSIFEKAVVACHRIGKLTACKILLDAALKLSQTNAALRHAYDDLEMMINLPPIPPAPTNLFEKKLANAVSQSQFQKSTLSAKELANELVPHLASLPVKSILHP